MKGTKNYSDIDYGDYINNTKFFIDLANVDFTKTKFYNKLIDKILEFITKNKIDKNNIEQQWDTIYIKMEMLFEDYAKKNYLTYPDTIFLNVLLKTCFKNEYENIRRKINFSKAKYLDDIIYNQIKKMLYNEINFRILYSK